MVGIITHWEERQSKTGKKFYSIGVDDGVSGSKYTAWPDRIGDDTEFKVGDVVEFGSTQNGSFKNIESIKLADPATAAKLKGSLQASAEDREIKIQRQSCLKAAIELSVARGDLGFQDIIELSEKFLLYVQCGMGYEEVEVVQDNKPQPSSPKHGTPKTSKPKVEIPSGVDDDIPF